jgi:hypothetical protein
MSKNLLNSVISDNKWLDSRWLDCDWIYVAKPNYIFDQTLRLLWHFHNYSYVPALWHCRLYPEGPTRCTSRSLPSFTRPPSFTSNVFMRFHAVTRCLHGFWRHSKRVVRMWIPCDGVMGQRQLNSNRYCYGCATATKPKWIPTCSN